APSSAPSGHLLPRGEKGSPWQGFGGRSSELVGIEVVVGRTELADDFDLAVDHHFGAVFRGEIVDHLFDALGRAGAALYQMLGLEDPDAGFVVEPEQQPLG